MLQLYAVWSLFFKDLLKLRKHDVQSQSKTTIQKQYTISHFKKQKQPPEVFNSKRCFQKFCKIHRTLEQVFSCEFCEISKSTFFQRTPLVAASEKDSDNCFSLNFLGTPYQVSNRDSNRGNLQGRAFKQSNRSMFSQVFVSKTKSCSCFNFLKKK